MTHYFENALTLLEEKDPALFFHFAFVGEACDGPEEPSLEEIEVLYLFGAKRGYPLVKPWLKADEKRHLVLVDNELGEWRALFDDKMGLELLEERQVSFFYLQSEGDYQRLAWHLPLRKWAFISLKEGGDQIREQVASAKKGVELVFVDYQMFGIDHFTHALCHLKRLKEVIPLSQLKGALQGQKALICGGGSSIYEHLDTIRDLEKCTYVFAGGKGAQLLHKEGINIDFIGAIDPANNYEEFGEISSKAGLVFYQDRVSSDLLAKSRAPLVFCGAPEGYDLLHFLYQSLGIDMAFEAGWDVSNFLFAIASYLGCTPIILAGQDHAYLTKEEAGKTNMPLKKRGDEKGNICLTKDDFLMACHWFSDAAKECIVYKIGKALLLEEIPLFEKSSSYSPIEKSSFALTPLSFSQPLEHFLTQFLASLERGLGFVRGWMHALDHKDKKALLQEIELKEEICYTHYLQPIWHIFKHSLGKEYELPFYQDALLKMIKAL